jgi:glutathione S-transferase
MPRLYVFTLSHFCEKALWACERKGVELQLVRVLPGLHLWSLRKLSRSSYVPLLVRGNDVIQDSSAIIDYLDLHYPETPLTPRDPIAEAEARRWETELNCELGETTRLLFYFHAQHDPRFFRSEWALGSPFWGTWFYMLALPLILPRLRSKYQIDEASAQRDLQRLRALFQRLDRHFAGQRYLAGDAFSRADLTLAALAAGMFRPPEHPAQQYARRTLASWVETMKPFRDTLTGERVLELYRTERRAQPAPAGAGQAWTTKPLASSVASQK